MGLEVSGVLGVVWLFIVIWAIIRTAQSPAGPVVKALWIVILLVVPLFGLIAWVLLGPK
ncbi:PLDc N-terminal domain-containing protein [Aquisalimonas sp.]|uniref:PLDc N-terminal domain-containing protein n=1 Tax=Aquisalimonas sp. TaxID=1872621 RepID=UPI0025B93573|nr:PLDc N-terminal domain-containing protein [Aquisalimonas sp.]